MSSKATIRSHLMRLILAHLAAGFWVVLAAEVPPEFITAEEKAKKSETDGQCGVRDGVGKEECECGKVLVPLRPYSLPDEMSCNQRWVTIGSLALGRNTGRWYYEFRYGRGAKMTQVGWVGSNFNLTRDFSFDGTGDDEHSFGADVERHCKRNGLERPQLVRWMSGELLGSVLGCAIDIDKGSVWFYLNGRRVENSDMKIKLPRGTMFFPAASSKGSSSFVFSWQELIFKHNIAHERLQPLSKCKVCQCPWPPEATHHTCSTDPTDDVVKIDGFIISQALQSLAPNRCGSDWDCSPIGVFKINKFILQCEFAVELLITIAMEPVDELKKLVKLLNVTKFQDQVFDKTRDLTELRIFEVKNLEKSDIVMEQPYITADKTAVELRLKIHGVSYKKIKGNPELAADLKNAISEALKATDSEKIRKAEPVIQIVGGGRVSYLNWYQLGLSGQIPSVLDGLTYVKGLFLGQNRLTGSIPSELGRMTQLVEVFFNNNELAGTLPSELFKLPDLYSASFAGNQLEGSIPTEISTMKSLHEHYLQFNRLTGRVPTEIGRLARIAVLWWQDNRLTGHLPTQFCYRSPGGRCRMASLKLSANALKGSIPDEFGRLTRIRVFRIMDNYLTGDVPSAMSLFTKVLKWEIGNNSLTGSLCKDRNWDNLMVYDSHDNHLTGSVPTQFGKFSLLYYLNVGSNRLQGELPTEMGKLKKLENLWILRNKFSGQIPSEFVNLRLMTNLFVSDNEFVGTLPKALCEMPNLATIWMSSNKFEGSIPECISLLQKLKYVLLSKNHLSGAIPTGFEHLDQLNALTLNDNMFTGHLNPNGLNMRAGGVNNKVVLMLQRNELSCQLPSKIMATEEDERLAEGEGQQAAHILVVLGNMFDGPQLPGWVRPQEKRSELLYNSRPGLDVMVWMFLCPCAFLGTIVLWRMLFGPSVWKIVLDALMAHTKHPLVKLYRGLLLACALTAFIPSMLLLLYRFGSGYYECGQDLAKTTAAYFKSGPIAQWSVIILWCCWLLGIGSFALIIPAYIPGTWEDHVGMPSETFRMRRMWFLIGHIAWLGAMTIISWPSFLYAIAKTLHDDNVIFFGKFKDNARKIVFYLAPLTQAVMDSLVAPNFAGGYARFFGCSQWTLLVMARAITTWIVLLATSVILVENCIGGWKWFWLVCRPGSAELDFTLSIPNPLDLTYDDILIKVTITGDDVCGIGSTNRALWWFYNRCDRTLLESLAPFLATRMAVAAFGLPSLYLLRFTHLGVDARYLLRKQCLALTAVLQVGIIWVPFVPVLMPLVVGAISLHLVACHYWTQKHPDAQVEDPNPAWMISICLKPSVAFASLLMLHYAWVNDFHGKHFLLCFVIVGLPVLYFTSRIVLNFKRQENSRLRTAGRSVWVELGRFTKVRKATEASGRSSMESVDTYKESANTSFSSSFVVEPSIKEDSDGATSACWGVRISQRASHPSGETEDDVEFF